MPVVSGSDNVQSILAALNIKEVWAGGVLRFGEEVVPPGTTLAVVNVQQGLVEGVNTATFNINASALLENDMGFICMRTDAVDPLSLTCPSFPTTFTSVTKRVGPSSDVVSIFMFTVPAGMGGNASVAINIANAGVQYVDAIFVRGKGNMTAYGAANGVNTAGVAIIGAAVPSGNGDSVLIACGTSVGATAASITSYTSTPLTPTDGVTVPKAGIVSWVVITDTPVTTTISNSPTGVNQMLAGAWIN